MLTCRELTEVITDYLEGRMSFAQRMAFHLHVGMCRSCRTYLKQMRRTVEVAGQVPAVQMPAEVEAELLARFRGWKKDPADGDVHLGDGKLPDL